MEDNLNFLKILEGGQLEFWNFTGGLFSQKKGDINPQINSEIPAGPWGCFLFCFVLSFFVENIRRRSVRVQKLPRGFILTKKGDINPPKNLETPPGPLGVGGCF